MTDPYESGNELWAKYQTEFLKAMAVGKERRYRYRTRDQSAKIDGKHLDEYGDYK